MNFRANQLSSTLCWTQTLLCFFAIYRPKPGAPTLQFCFIKFISLLISLLNVTGLNSLIYLQNVTGHRNKFAAKAKPKSKPQQPFNVAKISLKSISFKKNGFFSSALEEHLKELILNNRGSLLRNSFITYLGTQLN